MMNREDSGLKAGERLDDLQIKGYEIIQSPGRFCFGMDAVLLSSYAKIRNRELALDLGTGTGILPILLEAKNEGEHYTGLEIQEESADMARRSVSRNDMKGSCPKDSGRFLNISRYNINLIFQPIMHAG